MGMYTAFHIAIELEQDTPKEVIDVLKFMNGDIEEEPLLPDHEFFRCDRWRCLFRMDSYYFSAQTHSSLFHDERIAKSWFLTVTSNLKNYDNEIEKFTDWIMPYVANSDSFIGYSRYEESEEPTLIYKVDQTLLKTK